MNRSLKTLRSYLEKGGENPRWTPTPGVVVVGAGKGGIGTSTVAALLAFAGARDGRQVLLIDGDEGVGSLHLLLGMDDQGLGIGDLKGGELSPSDLLRKVQPSLWFLPGGGGGVDSTLATSLGERRALYQRVSTLYSDFDLVVLDGGSHLSSVLAACGVGAERFLALTTSDRVAMAATYALFKVIRDRFPSLPVEVLVNSQKDASSEDVFLMMSSATTRFMGLELRSAGSIPEDPLLEDLSREGRPLTDLPTTAPSLEATGLVHARLAAEQESFGAKTMHVLSASFSG
jgi:flagellar biosynthesis protein FlhG